MPESNNALLDPAGVNNSKRPGENKDLRKPLDIAIDLVKQFHSDIESQYHPKTYAQYGSQGTRLPTGAKGGVFGTGAFNAKDCFAWGEVVWKTKHVITHAPPWGSESPIVEKDLHNGAIQFADGRKLEIAPPDTPGDGTVPESSGAAPGQAGALASFVHGQGHAGSHNDEFGYDHQDSYNDKRTVFATLYSIVKIAQLADWRPE